MCGKRRQLLGQAILLTACAWVMSGCAQLPPTIRAVDPEVVRPPEQQDEMPQRQPTEDAPLGFAGRSRIAARDAQESNHIVPMPDRWRLGFPAWDRYGKGHPPLVDYPYVPGRWWDPFNQNVL
jgi:hypothetical protein